MSGDRLLIKSDFQSLICGGFKENDFSLHEGLHNIRKNIKFVDKFDEIRGSAESVKKHRNCSVDL